MIAILLIQVYGIQSVTFLARFFQLKGLVLIVADLYLDSQCLPEA